MKKLKDKIQKAQRRRSGEKAHHIYETYKNTVIPHGRHIYAKASDMEKATMCTYTQSDHKLPHCKYILRCSDECPYINPPVQETDKNDEEITPSIRFHIYHIIARCNDNGRIPFKDKKYVIYVNNNLHKINLKRYTPEKS